MQKTLPKPLVKNRQNFEVLLFGSRNRGSSKGDRADMLACHCYPNLDIVPSLRENRLLMLSTILKPTISKCKNPWQQEILNITSHLHNSLLLLRKMIPSTLAYQIRPSMLDWWEYIHSYTGEILLKYNLRSRRHNIAKIFPTV